MVPVGFEVVSRGQLFYYLFLWLFSPHLTIFFFFIGSSSQYIFSIYWYYSKLNYWSIDVLVVNLFHYIMLLRISLLVFWLNNDVFCNLVFLLSDHFFFLAFSLCCNIFCHCVTFLSLQNVTRFLMITRFFFDNIADWKNIFNETSALSLKSLACCNIICLKTHAFYLHFSSDF